MDCQTFKLELQKMLQTASDAAAPELIHHTLTCAKCLKAYERVTLLLTAISSEKKTSPGFYLQGKIMDRVFAEAKATIRIRPIRWQTAAVSLVAGVALGLLIGSVSLISTINSDETILTASVSINQDVENSPLEDYLLTADNDK